MLAKITTLVPRPPSKPLSTANNKSRDGGLGTTLAQLVLCVCYNEHAFIHTMIWDLIGRQLTMSCTHLEIKQFPILHSIL